MIDTHPNDKTSWIVETKIWFFTVAAKFDTEAEARKYMKTRKYNRLIKETIII